MLRNLTKEDLHWTNITLLSKFVDFIGGIIGKSRSRLPTELHKHMARSIKHLRALGVFPSNEEIRPTDKLPFTSLHSQFMEDTTKVVDPNTGKIKRSKLNEINSDLASYNKYDSAHLAYKDSMKR